jgi:hypothetical protein
MIKRKNCWEVMKCGRQPGGENVDKLGICPAAISGNYNGTNKGKFRGRFCWAVTGTLCEGDVQGTYAKKVMDCIHCKFLKHVNEEEGRDFKLTPKDSERARNE